MQVMRFPGLFEYASYKLIKWRFRYLAGNKRTIECRFPGIRSTIVLRPGHFDLKVLRAVLLEEEYRVELTEAPAVIVDAGAHIGLSAVYFANRYPEARIFSLEPNPENFAVLKANVAAYDSVHPINAALWHSRENLHWVDPDADDWAYRVTQSEDSPDTIPAIDLDSLRSEHGIDRIDLLKVDIEGAEAEVFSHNTGWIDAVRVIAIELHDRFRPGCKETFEAATADFEERWCRGENTFVARRGAVEAGSYR